jgi:hypothetical protein
MMQGLSRYKRLRFANIESSILFATADSDRQVGFLFDRAFTPR